MPGTSAGTDSAGRRVEKRPCLVSSSSESDDSQPKVRRGRGRGKAVKTKAEMEDAANRRRISKQKCAQRIRDRNKQDWLNLNQDLDKANAEYQRLSAEYTKLRKSAEQLSTANQKLLEASEKLLKVIENPNATSCEIHLVRETGAAPAINRSQQEPEPVGSGVGDDNKPEVPVTKRKRAKRQKRSAEERKEFKKEDARCYRERKKQEFNDLQQELADTTAENQRLTSEIKALKETHKELSETNEGLDKLIPDLLQTCERFNIKLIEQIDQDINPSK